MARGLGSESGWRKLGGYWQCIITSTSCVQKSAVDRLLRGLSAVVAMPTKHQIMRALEQLSGPGVRTIDPHRLRHILATDYGEGAALSASEAGLAVQRILNHYNVNSEGELLIEHVGASWAMVLGRKQKKETPYDAWQKQSSYCAPMPPLKPEPVVVAAPPKAASPPSSPEKIVPLAVSLIPPSDSGSGANLDLKIGIITGDARTVERVLSAGANPNAREDTGEFPLLWAGGLKDPDTAMAIVSALLRGGADPRQASSSANQSVAYIFSSKGHERLLAPLHAAGADLDASEATIGETPLCAACRCGHTRTVEALVALGADVHKATSSGETPLWIAACRGHLEAARVLLAAGATVDAHNAEGQTPLMKAAESGYVKLVELLLSRGADRALRSSAGTTALDVAIRGQPYAAVGEGLAVGGESDACITLLKAKAVGPKAVTQKSATPVKQDALVALLNSNKAAPQKIATPKQAAPVKQDALVALLNADKDAPMKPRPQKSATPVKQDALVALLNKSATQVDV